MKRTLLYSIVSAQAFFTASVCAQLTWTPDTNFVWDVVSANWTDATSPPAIVWDNTGVQEAIFSDPLGASVQIADGGVTVGDVAIAGNLSLQSLSDNLGRITIREGGAIWNTGGFEIKFLNNLINDTPLSIAADATLTIAGGGVFDTGEKPGADGSANWIAEDAVLDVSETTVVRGNSRSVGQFETARLVGDSSYVHERNVDETYTNNWVLDSGIVSFGNRWARNFNLNGVVSGEGALRAVNLGSRRIRINNVGNSFSGGLIVDSSGNRSEVFILGPGLPASGDGALGAVPATYDPDNIILREGGEIKFLNMVSIDANRGITIDGGEAEDKAGVIAISGNPVSYDGTITGTGGLQIGSTVGNDANALVLTSNAHDYTGGTTIHQGRLILGADEVLPEDSVLTIGGKNSSLFVVNGFTQTLSGLATAGNNTRQVINYDTATSPSVPTTAGTVIFDIADQPEVDQEFFFGSAFGVDENSDKGNLNIVKNGEGNIALAKVRVAGTVEVNAGALQIGNAAEFSVMGDITNSSVLIIDESATASSFTAEAGSELTFNWQISDWNGAAGTGYTQLTILGDATLNADSALNIVIEEANLANFRESSASFQITDVRGTTSFTPNVTLDATGFTSGTGTWALRSQGENLFLDYTAGAGDGSYTSWAAGFPALTGGLNDDDDSDGVANGLEFFFFNSDPTTASNLGAALKLESAAGDGIFVFTHDRPIGASDVTLSYEWSSTLDGEWTVGGQSENGIVVTITPASPVPAALGYETVTVTVSSDPSTLEKVFVRASVSLAP